MSSSELNRKVADITIGEQIILFQNIMKPIKEKIDSINLNLTNKLHSLEK